MRDALRRLTINHHRSTNMSFLDFCAGLLFLAMAACMVKVVFF